jgi:hypothetical protein
LCHTVESGLFREDEALNLIEPLMRDNALTLFS